MEMENGPTDFTDCECRVFLVDDDADDREFFSEALGEVGQKLRSTLFSNGADVLKVLFSGARLPDIIFLDLFMPVMDGESCLSEIRADSRFDGIRVVIFSTLMDTERIEELFNAGANRYLKKAFFLSGAKERTRPCDQVRQGKSFARP